MTTHSPSSPYITPAHRRALFGCVVTALTTAVMEAVHLNAVAGDALSLESARLVSLYAGAPLALSLCGLGLTLDLALRLKAWGEQGATASPSAQRAAWAALPVGVGAFAITLTLILSQYEASSTTNRALGAYFWLLPCAAIAAYLWHVARALLARLDLASGRPTSLIVALVIVGAPLALAGLLLPSGVVDTLLSWPVAGLVVAPMICAAAVAVSLLLPSSATLDALTLRLALALAALSGAGIIDLSDEMNHNEVVKRSLLDHTLMSGALLEGLRPLFDQDGDGVAGKLGGADCDDTNPRIYPGAKDIPLNGVDEDCHEGDALPPPALKPKATDGIGPSAPLTNASLYRRPARPNIILISIDTLRADHLHFIGYQRKTSPFLDELSLRGLNFEWTFATGAQTRISMPAVFTGRYCSELSRSTADWAKIYADNVTLAERLTAAGYHTVGVPSHNYFNSSYGLHQGFNEWNFTVLDRLRAQYEGEQQKPSYHKTGHIVTDEAIRWSDQWALQGSEQPFFLWLHYFDPHSIYREHAEYNFGKRDVDLYDAEIRYTDAQLERFFRSFELSPLAKNTYIILHSDHGEGFGEHGGRHHGQSLYNEQVRVPLLIVGPGLPPRKVTTPVSLIDITPTVLELAGVEPSPPEPRGSSLLKFAAQPNAEHHPVVMEMLPDSTHSARNALVEWPWKLHYSRDFGRFHLYDISKDPAEEVDRVESARPAFERLKRRLMRVLGEEITPIEPSNR